MFATYFNQLTQTIVNFHSIIILLTAILHILFASGVARDTSNLHKLGHHTQIVASWVWVLATLIGGALIASLYWVMHHSTLARRI